MASGLARLTPVFGIDMEIRGAVRGSCLYPAGHVPNVFTAWLRPDYLTQAVHDIINQEPYHGV